MGICTWPYPWLLVLALRRQFLGLGRLPIPFFFDLSVATSSCRLYCTLIFFSLRTGIASSALHNPPRRNRKSWRNLVWSCRSKLELKHFWDTWYIDFTHEINFYPMELKITYFNKDLRQKYTLGKMRLIFFFFLLHEAKTFCERCPLSVPHSLCFVTWECIIICFKQWFSGSCLLSHKQNNLPSGTLVLLGKDGVVKGGKGILLSQF